MPSQDIATIWGELTVRRLYTISEYGNMKTYVIIIYNIYMSAGYSVALSILTSKEDTGTKPLGELTGREAIILHL